MKKFYHRANNTLEGLSAPRREIGDAVAQGIEDFTIPQGAREALGPQVGEDEPEGPPPPADAPKEPNSDPKDPNQTDPKDLQTSSDTKCPSAASEDRPMAADPPAEPPALRVGGNMADAADPKGPSDDGAPSAPQIFQIEGEDWELPSYWNLREDAKPKLASATFYGRPDGSRHPDVLIVPDANGVRGGTVVRGKFIAKAKRHGAPSKRVPDCDSDLWFAQGGWGSL